MYPSPRRYEPVCWNPFRGGQNDGAGCKQTTNLIDVNPSDLQALVKVMSTQMRQIE